jgi:D-arabinose 1-dehydrogenase-like Zn-dependent alcohol dehydrogenase
MNPASPRRLICSPAGSRKDLRDTLDLAATHGVRGRVTPMSLNDAPKALKQMHEGNIHGRVVLVMD